MTANDSLVIIHGFKPALMEQQTNGINMKGQIFFNHKKKGNKNLFKKGKSWSRGT